jgi:predicted SAM-dependent methyltransferase
VIQIGTGRRLHIGGKVIHPEWEVLDALPGPHVNHVGNANDLSRFQDGTFSALYASHVAEHFGYQKDLLTALREWHRVLQPDGLLCVSVPDLDVLAELFLLRESLTIADRFQVMRMMFGGQTDPHDFHYVGLNEEFLLDFLRAAGFEDIRRVDEFSLFNDSSSFRFKGIPISLNLIARRTAPL